MDSGIWHKNWRERLPDVLAREWDIVVIGGGITGAGILLEAARNGLKALLVEQRDFAWGASSRSSKLVHGGLRYLRQGHLMLTRDSVGERQDLLDNAAGLVEPQSFAFPHYRRQAPSRWLLSLGLGLYDLIAGKRSARYWGGDDFMLVAPHIRQTELQGGSCFGDAKTDDARLTMRVLHEAIDAGGLAVNYLTASELLRSGQRVDGVVLVDGIGGASYRVHAKAVINATGAWADKLRGEVGAQPKLRPLRGSHLLLPAWRLPLAQAISLMHPRDGRPVFAYPWEGVSLVGTTDVDHRVDLDKEASISAHEVAYLMEALEFQFPHLGLGLNDIIATYAGVRPVIDHGRADPSKEDRDHAVWLEDGLLSVTGGKLTTFRLIALDVLKRVAPLLPEWRATPQKTPFFKPASALPATPTLNGRQRRRLQGRYGERAAALVQAAEPGELATITGSETLWAELRWAARAEAVCHLEDLLLRRTRLGLQLRNGGADILPRIRAICRHELGWNENKWEAEQFAYTSLWDRCYALPSRATIPDWRRAA